MPGPAAVPPTFTMSVQEDLTISLDPTNDLNAVSATAATLPTSTLVNVSTGQTITLANGPEQSIDLVTGVEVITQQLVGPVDLVTPNRYLLTIGFTASPTTNQFVAQIIIIASV